MSSAATCLQCAPPLAYAGHEHCDLIPSGVSSTVTGYGSESEARTVPLAYRGFRAQADGTVREGLRAQPLLTAMTGGVSVAAAVARFWQNFPKALEADHNTLSIRLFPQQHRDVYELQGGEQKTHTVWLQFDRQHGNFDAR